MDSLLRFSTAGSVDDGKSTLIGRLLYDARAVYDDQVAAIRDGRLNRSTADFDFSLLTDGLRAEREQGITIDVAYRYFATPRRRFIIADTPGHEQYTRNMATGASTADAAVILLDAARGLTPQSRLHLRIARLLGVPHLVAAVNKMDLVAFDRARFQGLVAQLGAPGAVAIPVSALDGDNVVHRSPRMPWYRGPSLLEHLESLPAGYAAAASPWRLPVQLVIRPDAGFRGYAGQLASGTLRPGDQALLLPSGGRARIRGIHAFGREVASAAAGDSVLVTLDRDVDLSRGDLLAAADQPPLAAPRLRAAMVWMHAEPARPGKVYLLKHTTRTLRARLAAVAGPAASLALNEIGRAEWEPAQPLFCEPYRANRALGSFIVIDPAHFATVGAGMVEQVLPHAD